MNMKLIIAVLFAMSAPCAAQETNTQTLLAQADPAIQERIKKIDEILQQSNVDPRRNFEAVREAQTLKESGATPEKILEQLAIFAATPSSRESQAIEARAILEVLHLKPDLVIRGLAPYLDSENEQLHGFVSSWMQYHDTCAEGPYGLRARNYEDYLEYVLAQQYANEEVPAPFIEYLYEQSPDLTLIVFYHAAKTAAGRDEIAARGMEIRRRIESNQREREKRGESTVPLPPMKKPLGGPPRQQEKSPPREILLAEHIVGNAIGLKQKQFDQEFQQALPAAKEQLAKLAQYEQWWVRRYVVEIMRRHRELRHDEILKKLEADDQALIGKSPNSITVDMSKR